MFTFKINDREGLAVSEQQGFAARDGFRWHIYLLPPGQTITELIYTDDEFNADHPDIPEGQTVNAEVVEWVKGKIGVCHCGSPRCTYPRSLYCWKK